MHTTCRTNCRSPRCSFVAEPTVHRLDASASSLGSVTADERGYSPSDALRSRDGRADTSSIRVLPAVLVETPGTRREGMADFPYVLKGGSLRSPPAPAAGGRTRPSSPAPGSAAARCREHRVANPKRAGAGGGERLASPAGNHQGDCFAARCARPCRARLAAPAGSADGPGRRAGRSLPTAGSTRAQPADCAAATAPVTPLHSTTRRRARGSPGPSISNRSR